MIRIQRAERAPIYADRATAYAAVEAAAADGKLKSNDFASAFYREEGLVDALKEEQFRKCCYCETAMSGFDVEHFRPKTKAALDPRSKKKSVGYWWLAYEPVNLVLACGPCNRLKSDHFPLGDPSMRLRPGEAPMDAGHETELLIDPARENPDDHVTYVRMPLREDRFVYRLAAKEGSKRGRATINLLGLDSADHDYHRDRYVEEDLMSIVRRWEGGERGAEIEKNIADRVHAAARYALLARCVFRDQGIPFVI